MVRREAQSSARIVSALKYVIALFTMASLLMSGACGASGNKGPLPSASKRHSSTQKRPYPRCCVSQPVGPAGAAAWRDSGTGDLYPEEY